MAERIAYGVAENLLNRLASAAFREFGRIYGIMDNLEKLKKTVESISAVLLDAEKKQEKSHVVQLWVTRLNDLLLTADDLIDELYIEDMIHNRDQADVNKVTKVLNSFSPINIYSDRTMAVEIEKIQESFNDIVNDMSGLNLNSNVVVVEKTNDVMRETSSFVLESDIIGRKDDKKKIISLLRKSHEHHNVSMVTIVGIGGLGKTTLAQMVYNDGEVQNLFKNRMWVCVSDNFEVRTILKKMMESLTNTTIDDKLSLDNLQKQLREKLAGERYLLVLDDLWNESFEKWAQLKPYLMCGAPGSKVVVTTRSETMQNKMDLSDTYTLNGLTQDESWGLLKKITFGADAVEVSQNLESIGNEIAEKCKGVPLAIRSLGGILQSNSDESEWINVLEGDFWKLCKDEDSIMPVLKLSYQKLSPQQRKCFAYCSLFPKDWEFQKDELIKMWMAQGYLDCSVEGKCMEDVGNQFVNIFLTKSFFQDAKVLNGDVCEFKIHDLQHDLAIQVAGNACCYVDRKSKRCLGKLVHVSIKFDDFYMLKSLDTSRLRTLIVFCSSLWKVEGVELLAISNFKYLRVLKLDRCYYGDCDDLFKKLKHLRHLGDICCGKESFHKSICNLVCLQTLKLILDGETVLSTKDVSKLINLRHLEMINWTFKGLTFFNWLSPLTNIIEISLIDCQGLQYLPPLERLPFLKSLSLIGNFELKYIYYEEPILHEPFFQSLESLNLNCCERLKGWRRMGDDFEDILPIFNDFEDGSLDGTILPVLLPPFRHLSKLNVDDVIQLTCMPTFPNVKKLLSLRDCNVEILEATLNMPDSQYWHGCPPLSMLESLEINQTFIGVKKFPKDWLKNLTSLKNLHFYQLSSGQFQKIEMWFKDVLNCLPLLQKIKFSNCDELKACQIGYATFHHFSISRSDLA